MVPLSCRRFVVLLLSATWLVNGFNNIQRAKHPKPRQLNAQAGDVTIYGHPGTRSPLVNWACLELGVSFKMGNVADNPHPFQQLPCLSDADDVVVFESGAILQYLFDVYGDHSLSRSDKAMISSWIYWANASFDPICFVETPQGKVYDTGLRQPNHRVDELDYILSQRDWILGDDMFTLADIAVASYGLYVLLFFPNVSIAEQWPALAGYLKRAAQRSAYAQAFGEEVQTQLVKRLRKDLEQQNVPQ